MGKIYIVFLAQTSRMDSYHSYSLITYILKINNRRLSYLC